MVVKFDKKINCPDTLTSYIPEIDKFYNFHEGTAEAIKTGFTHNKKVLVTGLHGSGKTTHIEQVAANLGYPCVRVNLDGHIGRIDLIGRDAIVLKDGKQITEFREGILPWAMRNGVALILDEYDAARPDILFVLQQVLEDNGKLTLVERNEIIEPHENFRLFATTNTIGMGDETGLYQGTNILNQGQLDRWSLVVELNYIDHEDEVKMIKDKLGKDTKEIEYMVSFANLTRNSFSLGDISVIMSPRAVLNWANNWQILGDIKKAFELSYLNKTPTDERELLWQFYEKCFG